MFVLLLAAAAVLAGGPLQACATDANGATAFVSPRDGRLFLWTGGAVKLLATVPLPGGGKELSVVVARPGGGWWVGAEPTWEVDAAGAVKAGTLEPSSLRAALVRGPASRVGGSLIWAESGDVGGVVVRLDADGSQTTLWRHTPTEVPLGLFATPEAIYALRRDAVIRDAGGAQVSLPLPATRTVGVCGAAGGPLLAVTVDGHGVACLSQAADGAWTRLACGE